jgi:hypothetical protein
MSTQITCHLPNTPQQYYVLRVYLDGGKVIAAHTSKDLAYLRKMQDRYKEPRCI